MSGATPKSCAKAALRLVGLSGLGVHVAEDVGQLEIVLRPFPRFFQVGQGVGQAAGQVQRKAQHLHGLASLHGARGEVLCDGTELGDGLCMVVGVVMGDPSQIGHPRIGRVEGGEPLQGLRDAALVDEAPDLGQGGRRLRAATARSPEA